MKIGHGIALVLAFVFLMLFLQAGIVYFVWFLLSAGLGIMAPNWMGAFGISFAISIITNMLKQNN